MNEEHKSVLVMGDWLKNCSGLTKEQNYQIRYWILEYGIFGKLPEDGDMDQTAQVVFNFIKPQISNMTMAYEERVNKGKAGGRKENPFNDQIYELAKAGKSGKEIAAELNINVKTIYSTPGWKKAREEKTEKVEDKIEFSF